MNHIVYNKTVPTHPRASPLKKFVERRAITTTNSPNLFSPFTVHMQIHQTLFSPNTVVCKDSLNCKIETSWWKNSIGCIYKPVAIAIIKLHLSEGISKSVSDFFAYQCCFILNLPFHQPQQFQCLHHGSTKAYLCSPLCSTPFSTAA